MRLIIFTLALVSAFFVSKVHAFRDPDLSNLVEPKQKIAPCEQASFNGSGGHKVCGGPDENGNDIKKQSCDLLAGDVQPESTNEYDWTTATCIVEGGTYKIKQAGVRIYSDGYRLPTNRFWSLYFANLQGELTYSCPPDGHPENTIEVPNSESGLPAIEAGFYCAKIKEPEDCPAGHHSKSVSSQIGGSECVPKECPPSGSNESLYSSPTIGGVPFNTGGLYCHDGCAYSVSSSAISSQKHASGMSQGIACGDKPYDNKKLAEEGDDGFCSTSTINGVSLLICNKEPEPEEPQDPTTKNDESKVDDSEKPKLPKETCSEGDIGCELRNLQKQSENDSLVLTENMDKLHNKMVDVQTKNTNAIKSSLDDLTLTTFLGQQKEDAARLAEQSKLDKIIEGILAGNQIAIDKPVGGGSGGGTGTSPTDGTCVGSDCSEDSKYNGECDGELCDLDIVPELEQIDNSIIEWFNESLTLPSELTSSFTNITSFITTNFSSFNGTCVPFTLDVSIRGDAKSIPVSQHCEPYETYFKPLVEWLLWTLTAFTLFNMFAQVFRNFSRI